MTQQRTNVLSSATAFGASPYLWTLRVEGGLSRIHTDDRGMGGAMRIAREIGAARRVDIQAGVMSGNAYAAFDLGVEAHLFTLGVGYRFGPDPH